MAASSVGSIPTDDSTPPGPRSAAASPPANSHTTHSPDTQKLTFNVKNDIRTQKNSLLFSFTTTLQIDAWPSSPTPEGSVTPDLAYALARQHTQDIHEAVLAEAENSSAVRSTVEAAKKNKRGIFLHGQHPFESAELVNLEHLHIVTVTNASGRRTSYACTSSPEKHRSTLGDVLAGIADAATTAATATVDVHISTHLQFTEYSQAPNSL
jgi:hypothetical protein